MRTKEIVETGIYYIRNIVNNKIYIGSAQNFRKRVTAHKSELNTNRHHSPILQNAWNKYGEQSFHFFMFEYCNLQELMSMEQLYLDFLNPEYNICKIAGSSRGRVPSAATREKYRVATKRRWDSGEMAKRKVVSQKGKELSQQHLENVRVANSKRKGKHLSEQDKLNKSIAAKKRWNKRKEFANV